MDKYSSVDEYLSGLDDGRKDIIAKLREYIVSTEPSLGEHIKWNALSFVKNDVDRITFNTLNKEHIVKIVFHMGALRKEDKKGTPVLQDADLIEWVSDIRGYMTFRSMGDVTSNENEIKRLVRHWLVLG